jgi:hypothetical protein
MRLKIAKPSKLRKLFGTILFIFCVAIGIIISAVIHFKILTDANPSYSFNEFAITFLWMDVLIGLGVGFVLFIIIGIVVAYYLALKGEESSEKSSTR